MTGDISNADLEWLANDKTSPGPGVGESIDPTKPGPTADRIAELAALIERLNNLRCISYMQWELPQSLLDDLRTELSRLSNPELNSRGEPMDHATIARGRKPTDAENAPLRNEQPKGGDAARRYKGAGPWPDGQFYVWDCKNSSITDPRGKGVYTDWPKLTSMAKAEECAERLNSSIVAAAPSPATSPGPQDVRWKIIDVLALIKSQGVELRYILTLSQLFEAADSFLSAFPALDAQPVGWQYRYYTDELGHWSDWRYCSESEANAARLEEGHEVRPLFTTPPSLPEGAREALEFYEREWRGNMEGDGSTPGLARTWMEPTDALLDDAGTKAKAALATPTPSSAGLIETAECSDKEIQIASDAYLEEIACTQWALPQPEGLRASINAVLRARAADRSAT